MRLIAGFKRGVIYSPELNFFSFRDFSLLMRYEANLLEKDQIYLQIQW